MIVSRGKMDKSLKKKLKNLVLNSATVDPKNSKMTRKGKEKTPKSLTIPNTTSMILITRIPRKTITHAT